MGEEDGRPRPEICSRPLGRYQSSKFHTTEGIKSIEDRITVLKDAFPCQVYIKIVSGLKKNQKANQSKAHERTHGYICLPRPSQKLKTQTQNPPEESKKEKKRKEENRSQIPLLSRRLSSLLSGCCFCCCSVSSPIAFCPPACLIRPPFTERR